MNVEPDPNPSAAVLHDLRTPLGGISLALDLLAEGKIGELNERQASLVRQAREDCRKLGERINGEFGGDRRDG